MNYELLKHVCKFTMLGLHDFQGHCVLKVGYYLLYCLVIWPDSLFTSHIKETKVF